ncbi:FecCD family ABC transporter permease [Paenibacillus pini]|uniref:ABC-type Fe3+-siderophore transport system n=1 Tax=Paenibacillus pini JCM 16418 TaxID=1236976 RepID=W7YRL6_9BACL|nr:iron ABC transporter permease [Paenibacillus pini]GAF07251.1 ABC-type Fe3+-siderophore transport system [Paenibacillus pini JCM 16418]
MSRSSKSQSSISVRWGTNASFLTSRRQIVILALLSALVLLSIIVSIGFGTKYVNPWNVIRALFHQGNALDVVVVQKLRLPRTLVGAMVGACLAISGAITQGLIRNPLASPDVMGVTGGASVATTAVITLIPSASVFWLPPAAFIGATLTTVLIYILSRKNGVNPLMLVLIGVGIGSVSTSLSTMLLVTGPSDVAQKAFDWLLGSVYGTSWKHVNMILPWFIILTGLSLVFARRINMLQLGDDLAAGAGSAVEKDRTILLFTAVGLAGAGISVGGAIGFVALLAPHIARKLVGPSYGSLIPASALVGAFIVVTADVLARTLFDPLDIPVGVFTSAIGAPFFIFLLWKSRSA